MFDVCVDKSFKVEIKCSLNLISGGDFNPSSYQYDIATLSVVGGTQI